MAFAAFVLHTLCGAAAVTQAQQTLFNVPSTDVLNKGKVYGELDTSFRPIRPGFLSCVPRVVVGVGGRVEVGLNLAGNVQPGADTTTIISAIKWKAYEDLDAGWAIVVGDSLSIPARNRSYRAGNYFYAQVGKTLGTRTRLTFGGYHFTRGVIAARAQRAGGQFGFEQPLTAKFSIQADWFTGKHANGYFTPGFAYKLTGRLVGYFGYSLGNTDFANGNHFFYWQVGVNFN